MALYKALNSDFRSQVDHHCGWLSEPWVVGEWKEKSPIWWDISGAGKRLGKGPHSGYFCSDDILWAMSPEFTRYIAEVEVDGQSITYRNCKSQCWQKMRVVKIKAWPASKATLVIDWCEGRVHDWWEDHFPTEAQLYDTRHYQGNFAAMLSIIQPLYKSLFVDGAPGTRFFNRNLHHLKPEYTWAVERILRLAYILALALTGNITPYGGNLAQMAEDIRLGSWETVRGFTEDHWNSLEEL